MTARGIEARAASAASGGDRGSTNAFYNLRLEEIFQQRTAEVAARRGHIVTPVATRPVPTAAAGGAGSGGREPPRAPVAPPPPPPAGSGAGSGRSSSPPRRRDPGSADGSSGMSGPAGRPPSPTLVFGPSGVGVSATQRQFATKATLVSAHTYAHRGLVPKEHQKTFMGSNYHTFRLEEDFVLYRAGRKDIATGQFFSFERPASELQTRIDKGLPLVWPDGTPSVVEKAYAVKVPKGTIVHVGETAPQGDLFLGGTKQIYIEKPWLIPGIEFFNPYTIEGGMAWKAQARTI